MRMRTILVILLVLGAAGCGDSSAGATLDVVASTNVYGDIAAQIGGSHVHVTSLLDNPNADPHLFEPGTQNGLAVAEARLAIQNGAGYDDFMGKLEAASPSKSRIVVTIADVLDVHGRDANPHVWYDVPRLPRIAGSIATGLASAADRLDGSCSDPHARRDYATGKLSCFSQGNTPSSTYRVMACRLLGSEKTSRLAATAGDLKSLSGALMWLM